MKTTQRESEEKDHFDLLPYIAILMCVLGCLLLVGMSLSSLSLHEDSELRVTRAAAEKLRDAQTNLAAIKAEAQKARQKLQEKASEVALAKECDGLQRQVEERKRQKEERQGQVTQEQIKAAQARQLKEETTKLQNGNEAIRKQIEEREKALRGLQTPGPGPSGAYRGQYVLVECVDKAAVVYTSKRRISTDTDQLDLEWLTSAVKKTGAVALIARPSGFSQSFPKLQEALGELASKNVKLILWPLEDTDPISPWLENAVKL